MKALLFLILLVAVRWVTHERRVGAILFALAAVALVVLGVDDGITVAAAIQLPFSPRAFQRAAHAARRLHRFVVLVWHRRAGKTVFAVLELVMAALLCSKERGRYAYIAPQLKQAKTVVWDYLCHFARFIPGVVINQSELSVTFPQNGAQVRLYGADNPDGLRGIYLDGVVLDEVAQMKANIWGEILRPTLSDRLGWAIFIGTPKGINLFSQLYFGVLKGDDKYKGWHADIRRASETNAVDPVELADAKNTMTEAEYAQEYECDFSAATADSLLSVQDVSDAMARSAGEAEYTYAPKVMGVDVARYGDDLNVIIGRQGVMVFQPRHFGGLDTMNVASQVAHSIDRWRPDGIFVDSGGIGAGVADRLRQLGYPVVDVPFGGSPFDTRFQNKRAEMWWQMADFVRDGGCLPSVERLRLDLTAPTYQYANAKGKFQLESKDEMKARGLPSTDFGDALACTFAFPVAATNEYGIRNQGRVQTEYDTFGTNVQTSAAKGVHQQLLGVVQQNGPAFVATDYDTFGGAY